MEGESSRIFNRGEWMANLGGWVANSEGWVVWRVGWWLSWQRARFLLQLSEFQCLSDLLNMDLKINFEYEYCISNRIYSFFFLKGFF